MKLWAVRLLLRGFERTALAPPPAVVVYVAGVFDVGVYD